MTEKEIKAQITQAHIDGLNRGYAKAKDEIKQLKEQIEKMKTELDNARESANRQEQWEIYSVLNDLYNDNFEITKGVSN